MAKRPVQRNAFVVRIWQEDGAPWQGWVQHAGSRTACYVRTLPELVDFIEEWTGRLAPGEGPLDAKTELL